MTSEPVSDLDGKPCRIDGEWHSTRSHHDSERDARVRAQLRADIAKGVEGLPNTSGGHWDHLWDDATGAHDSWHECPSGLLRAAVLALIRGEDNG